MLRSVRASLRRAALLPLPASEGRERDGRGEAGGFSLIEVVVALALLGMLLAGLAQAVRGGLGGNARAISWEAALALAESRLAAIGTEDALRAGTQQGSFGALQWRSVVEEASRPDDPRLPPLWRLRVEVAWSDARPLVLETLRLGKTPTDQ